MNRKCFGPINDITKRNTSIFSISETITGGVEIVSDDDNGSDVGITGIVGVVVAVATVCVLVVIVVVAVVTSIIILPLYSRCT